MKINHRTSAIALVVSALIQWLGVGERIIHGLWQWYKFSGFGNTGNTTVSIKMASITYLLSLLLIVFGIYTYRHTTEALIAKSIKFSTLSLVIGVLTLAVLLVSPIAQLVAR